ncbi:hypothetical protein [Micrococcus luteus]|uniref:hypothetical protein n=1 Tax=Micrococcus luteus TaxID=1270 RepID=UPI003F6E1DF6
MLWGWLGEKLTEEKRDGVSRVLEGLSGALGRGLAELLGAKEIEALAKRCTRLLDAMRLCRKNVGHDQGFNSAGATMAIPDHHRHGSGAGRSTADCLPTSDGARAAAAERSTSARLGPEL